MSSFCELWALSRKSVMLMKDTLPLLSWSARGIVERGIAICGSGVGASVAANKVRGIRAGLRHDTYSARQGVEHDDMDILVLGGGVIGPGTGAGVGWSASGSDVYRGKAPPPPIGESEGVGGKNMKMALAGKCVEVLTGGQ